MLVCFDFACILCYIVQNCLAVNYTVFFYCHIIVLYVIYKISGARNLEHIWLKITPTPNQYWFVSLYFYTRMFHPFPVIKLSWLIIVVSPIWQSVIFNSLQISFDSQHLQGYKNCWEQRIKEKNERNVIGRCFLFSFFFFLLREFYFIASKKPPGVFSFPAERGV